jgi:hypothetical protein
MEVPLDGGKGDVHHGGVEDDHQLTDAQDHKGQPTASVGRLAS